MSFFPTDVGDGMQQVTASSRLMQPTTNNLSDMGHCPGCEDDSSSGCVLRAEPSDRAASSAGVKSVPECFFLPPSDDELSEALTMSTNLDFSNSQDCFRVLVSQNSVILRDALHRRALQAQAAKSVLSSPTTTSSACTSSSGSDGTMLPLTSGDGVGILKPSPPKNFQCPVCLSSMNEKDFDRHIKSWIVKSRRPSSRKTFCPGIREIGHPLLNSFPQGSLQDMVCWLVSDIRSLLRPGAYDTLQPGGSGRHLIVAQRFAQLQNPVAPVDNIQLFNHDHDGV